MLKVSPDLVLVVVHTIIIYLFLIFVLRLLGRRQTSELSVTELVIIMVLGSAVETARVAKDTSLAAGLLAAAVLLLSNRVMSILLRHWKWLHRLMLGRPIPLVYHGRLLPNRMREAGLTEADILEGIRKRGYADLDRVRLAVLELDGVISVVPGDTSSDGDDSGDDETAAAAEASDSKEDTGDDVDSGEAPGG